MDLGALIARILARPRVAYIMAVLDVYGRAAGGLLANGLAFSSLFAAIPTFLLVLGLTGFIVADPAVYDRVAQTLQEAFPPLADLIESALAAIKEGAALTSLLATLGVLWTVSQLYVTLDVAFSRIFSERAERDIVRRTARGFVLVVLIGAVIIAIIVVASLGAALDALTAGDLPVASLLSGLIGSVWFMSIVTTVAVALVYRLLPPHPPRWRSLVPPAVLVGIGLVLLTQLFMFLVPRLVGVAALAGSIASAFIALAWLSFSFQALLYGAAWVRVRDEGVPPPASALGGATAPAEPGGRGE